MCISNAMNTLELSKIASKIKEIEKAIESSDSLDYDVFENLNRQLNIAIDFLQKAYKKSRSEELGIYLVRNH